MCIFLLLYQNAGYGFMLIIRTCKPPTSDYIRLLYLLMSYDGIYFVGWKLLLHVWMVGAMNWGGIKPSLPRQEKTRVISKVHKFKIPSFFRKKVKDSFLDDTKILFLYKKSRRFPIKPLKTKDHRNLFIFYSLLI